MKTTSLVALCAAFQLIVTGEVWAQSYNARSLTRRIAPQTSATNRPQPSATSPRPAASPQPATVAPRRIAIPPAMPTTAPVDPEKKRQMDEQKLKKTVEFEKLRATEDFAWAQYALGMRYLNGEGVEKDLVAAREWIEKAARNGDSQAIKKLKELQAAQ